MNYKESNRSGKKITHFILLSICMINLLFRYPRVNFPSGIDGILITALTNTINFSGEIGWFISIFSLIGFYPFSYASGFPVLLVASSQVMGIEMYKTILVVVLTLSILGTLSSFMMAKLISQKNSFSLFFCFLFSTAPLFIRFTSWQASTRTILIAFVPLFIWLFLTTYYRSGSRLRFSSLLVTILLLTFSFHRAANLFPLFIISYFVSILIFRKKNSFNLTKFRKNILYSSWFLIIIFFISLQAYKFGIYEEYNLGLKYETGRFFKGNEGHIIMINMLIDYGSRSGLLSVFAIAGLVMILFKNHYKRFSLIFVLIVFLSFSWILTFGLYVSLVLLPFICLLMSYGIFFCIEKIKLRPKTTSFIYSLLVILCILFSNTMLSLWGTYESTTNGYEYNAGIYSSEYIQEDESSVTDGDWGTKIFTISDSMYMRDDVTPLPMAYGWLNESYTSTQFNFDDVIIRKTIIDSEGDTQDFEEYWENLALRIYTKPVDQTVAERNLFNINYAFNHKLIEINDYEIITSSESSRYCLFENDEIEIFRL